MTKTSLHFWDGVSGFSVRNLKALYGPLDIRLRRNVIRAFKTDPRPPMGIVKVGFVPAPVFGIPEHNATAKTHHAAGLSSVLLFKRTIS